MARNRFVVPGTVRLDISDGDWIEVRERLDFGETQALTAAMLSQTGTLTGGEAPTVTLDMAGYKVERMAVYVVEWSFRDANDRPVEVSRATIKSLDVDTANEIDAALDAHIEATGANPTTPTVTSTSP